MYKGFTDSLKGAIVLFYMDKQINERLALKFSLKPVEQRKDLFGLPNSAKQYEQKYVILEVVISKVLFAK